MSSEVDVVGGIEEQSVVLPGGIGALGAHLQGKVDMHHAASLQKHSQRIAELNYNLRHILDKINSECKRMQSDPSIEPPYDLRGAGIEDAIEQLENLYKEYREEFNKEIPGGKEALEELEEKRLFPEDISQISEADMKVILDAIEQMQKANKDEVQNITQNLYLLGQLFITITDIIRKMDETHRRFLERIAEKLGMR